MTAYTVVSGSTRKNSQSGKVARFVVDALRESDPEGTVDLHDLSEVALPAWREEFWDDGVPPDPEWAKVSASLKKSDGLVFVAPEWDGMAPPALMNVFLLASRGEIAHKPALLVGVSATSGGAYPVAEMRAFGGKNTQVVYVPDHVVVRRARHVLNGPEPVDDADASLRARLAYSLRILCVYARAFVPIRASGVIDLETYPYGM
jgi:NAD(P)H-dependent FMN reductase